MTAKKTNYWVPNVAGKMKKGLLHKHLHVPKGTKIDPELLDKVLSKELGESFQNNGFRIEISPTLKKEAVLAKRFAGFHPEKKENKTAKKK